MTIFIVSALLITAIALLIMLRPLFRPANAISYARQAQNIHYAKERLAELELQLKNASISATDYEALKLEIESTLADDIDLQSSNAEQTASTDAASPQKSNTALIVFIALFLPISGLLSYWWLGTPKALEERVSETQIDGKDVEAMMVSLQARLADNPEDIQGWTILSRTYLALGRYQDAKAGFLKLIELQGETADTLASLADTTALMAGGNLQGEPTSYVERALAIQADHPQSLWMAGLSAAQAANPDRARLYWNQLLPLLENTPQQQQELREIIQQTFAEQGINVANSSQAADQNTSESGGISISIKLSSELANKVAANDTVFVFARAKDGPPAPLAVKRLTASDLPAQITLSDRDAMMPQFKLSLFEQVVISARVAKSGDPVAQAGDFQSAVIETSNTSSDLIELTIADIVE